MTLVDVLSNPSLERFALGSPPNCTLPTRGVFSVLGPRAAAYVEVAPRSEGENTAISDLRKFGWICGWV